MNMNTRSIVMVGVALGALGASQQGLAASGGADGFQIFGNLQSQTQSPSPLAIDLDPAAPGREHLNINFFQCTVSTPDGNQKITAQLKVRISANSADGATKVFSTEVPAVSTSKPFPDPRIAAHQCGAPGVADYHGDYESFDGPGVTNWRTLGCPASPGNANYGKPFTFDSNSLEFCYEFPRFNIGVGTAQKAATRVLLVGVGLKGVLEKPAFEDVSTFTITAYNMNGTKRWSKGIPAVSGSGRLVASWARVGDFLDDDGNDEIRIVYIGSTYRYVYYDVLTGALTKTVNVAP